MSPSLADVTTTAPTYTRIPDVDLARWSGSGADRTALAHEVREICHELGFFHVVGHGVPDRFRREWDAALRAFFALPEDVKASIDKAQSPYFRGWERVGAELTDHRTDFREQLDVGTEHPPYAPGVEPSFLRLDGPNQWLPESVLPGFRAIVGEFQARMGAVADRLGEVLCVGLGLAPRHLHDLFGDRLHAKAKLIRYPPSPPGEAGVNAHHDTGFLTVLGQHGVGGLQALGPDGSWIDVEPRDDAYVVNLGEILQAMTGNYLVATTHRVIATEARFSSAYFHGPDLRTRLDPLPLGPEFAAAVAASLRHSSAGFMASRDELVEGRRGTSGRTAEVYGQQLWKHYQRSYPDNVARHYPDLAP